jgi:membrane associated rhomboid family serine protease
MENGAKKIPMWRRHIIKVTKYQYPISESGSRISAFYDRVTGRVLHMLATPPPRSVVDINRKIVNVVSPLSKRVFAYQKNFARRVASTEAGRAMAALRYKGVAGLIGANLTAFMILNSHFMKSRSHADGLQRSDRHFIASRYNISRGRLWCVPLSLFNHGDSMMHLAMNCLALSIVGPVVEVGFGAGALVAGFLFTGSVGAVLEMMMGNHWCRGSSAGVSGVFGIGAWAAPAQLLSIWGVMEVRAASLALTLFGVESMIGLFGSHSSDMAHMAHAGGILASLPFLYYLRWLVR